MHKTRQSRDEMHERNPKKPTIFETAMSISPNMNGGHLDASVWYQATNHHTKFVSLHHRHAFCRKGLKNSSIAMRDLFSLPTCSVVKRLTAVGV